MKVKSILKVCGSTTINIIENKDPYNNIAIIDYNMTARNRESEKIYDCRVSLPEEIQNRNVDFFTSSRVINSNDRLVEGINIYVK
jgi:hypothetical protein